jgi:DNA (cytosine-5)-methyltransferase 1
MVDPAARCPRLQCGVYLNWHLDGASRVPYLRSYEDRWDRGSAQDSLRKAGLESEKLPVIGVDLFAGAGGMSLGAVQAGIDVRVAVDKDLHACETYAANFPDTVLLGEDVARVHGADLPAHKEETILFGGPPCQGVSTSNQRDRGTRNPRNQLFAEFLRITKEWRPDYVVMENVRGLLETANGLFLAEVIAGLRALGYMAASLLLNAADFGVPQRRVRVFVIAARKPHRVALVTPPLIGVMTVRDAIDDLPVLENGAAFESLPYRTEARSTYAHQLRGSGTETTSHYVTRNASHIVRRYKHVPQGGNWRDIPSKLMQDYAARGRCHTAIYHRLREDAPAIVIGNYRKSMIIHPTQDRGLSVREAARIQSFPDAFEFCGSIGFRQQQVGNAVPPLLARRVFEALVRS